MGEGFGTRPDELAAVAGRFDEAARAVAHALATLHSTLDGLGDYPGSDDVGRAFAARYDPMVADGFVALTAETDAARSLGDALRGAAREYRTGDEGAAAPFRSPSQ